MLADLKYHYETMGRILAHMVKNGLSRIDIEKSDVIDIMTPRNGEEKECLRTFADVFSWMSAEGLVRHGTNYDSLCEGIGFSEVQLTSRGLAVINARVDDVEVRETIEKTITEQPEEGLSSKTYVKIGSLIGGIIGGLTKSLG